MSLRAEAVRRVGLGVCLFRMAEAIHLWAVVQLVWRSRRGAHDPVCLLDRAKPGLQVRREPLDSLQLLVAALLHERQL